MKEKFVRYEILCQGIRQPKPGRPPYPERGQEASLKFYLRGDLVLYSFYRGCRVYMDKHLAQMVLGRLEERDIPKVNIKVYLRKGWDLRHRCHFYTADNRRLQLEFPKLKFEDCQQPVVVIDGANFFITLETIRHEGVQLSIEEALKAALTGLQPVSRIELVIAEGDQKQFAKEIQAIKKTANGQLRIHCVADQIRLVAGQQQRRKSDDYFLAKQLYELAKTDKQSQLIILFSGDKYFSRPLHVWLRDKAGVNRRLVVVSSQLRKGKRHGFVAADILETVNHPQAVLLPLEELAQAR